MTRLLTIAAAAAALTVAGCGGDGASSGNGASAGSTAPGTAAAGTSQTTTAAGAPGTALKTQSSDYGTILFDGKDQAIYLFTKETANRSECYGDCATAWPPVLTKGEPQAAGGADASLLGTTKRNDGSAQVTYKRHPLYYYHGDPPGQVLCQNVDEFGGLWLVVKPSGEPVQGG